MESPGQLEEGLGFASRLKYLIGDSSISAFGRKVDLGESLIRKYLKGSDPGLSKVIQIAKACKVDIRWLALGDEAGDA